ncbi:MAG: phage tail protein, partial [Desulfuromusa sp.]|nr:phage tail protein [Desulfuromusa sp.]
KNFFYRKATKNNLHANWKSKGEPVGLVQFGARQNRKGVSVKVETADARTTIDHAFIQLGQNGREHVFWREKRGGKMVPRYDILRLEGPRIEDALSKPKVQKALQKKADEMLQKRLDAEANYILSRAGKL